jgi:predicted PurR-regulated permease PerM
MFLSLLYWGYVLGVSGALVAIPLTIVVKIMLVSFKETKWIARFMGLLGD